MTGQYRCTYTVTVGNTGVSIQGLGSTGVRKQYGQYRCTYTVTVDSTGISIQSLGSTGISIQ